MLEPLSLSQLTGPLPGRVVGGDARFDGVSIDSRKIAPGQLFVALTGPRFDGHDYLDEVAAKGETIASRKASQNALNAFGPLLPEFLGGSADLAGSNLTLWKGCKGVEANDASGNYVFYGVREFGMTAIMNGVALHGGFIPTEIKPFLSVWGPMWPTA